MTADRTSPAGPDRQDPARPAQVGPPTIGALTGIRIVAAAWVVFGHFELPVLTLFPGLSPLRTWMRGGYLGVEIFFVLSGFIISYNYAERFRRPDRATYRHFLRLRFARLYPVHLITLLAVAALVLAAAAAGVPLASAATYDPVSFAMNVLLLQAVPPATGWNGPAWSISAEAGAYVAFPLLAVVVVRIATRRAALAGVVASVAATVVLITVLWSGRRWSSIDHGSIWIRIAGEFTAGCFLWAYWRRSSGPSRRWDIAAVASLGLALAALPLTRPRSTTDLLVLPLLVLFVLACARSAGPVRRALSSRWFDYGGRVSYSLYMTHIPVYMVLGKALDWDRYASGALPVRLAVLAAYGAALVLASVATYHLVEEPGRRLLRRRSAAAQAHVPALDLVHRVAGLAEAAHRAEDAGQRLRLVELDAQHGRQRAAPEQV
jgi:peptidoglycan/LPS O-acetylase OafA/YrhL